MEAEDLTIKIEGIEKELVRLRKNLNKSIRKVHKLKWEVAKEEVKEEDGR